MAKGKASAHSKREAEREKRDEQSERRTARRAPRRLYHYTTKRALDSILSSGELKPSGSIKGRTADDMALGPGIYLTSLPPQSSDDTLSLNNWDGSRRGVSDERLEAYISFRTVDLKKIGYFCVEFGRIVCVVRKPLQLSRIQYTTGMRKRFRADEED